MKKTLLTAALCMFVALSFAQKQAIKDAKSALGGKAYGEARELIKPALTNQETSNDPEAWKVAGDIEDEQFNAEKVKEMLQKAPDKQVMFDALYNTYDPYVKADELGELPDAKGKVKNKFRKDIAAKLKANHQDFINGGIFFNEKQDYARAADFFEKYWNIPSLSLFGSDKDKLFNTNDSTFQTIKYYTVICANQAKDHQRAIKFLDKIVSEPFTPNSTYKESDVYELLSSEYEAIGDSVSFLKSLESGAAKFPQSKYFVPNLINTYLKQGQTEKALAYLDKSIADDPTNACDMNSVKASLFADKKDFVNANATYEAALKSDPNCERALEGLAVSYIIQAQDVNDEMTKTSSAKDQAILKDKAKSLFSKAYPLLEKYKGLLTARNAETKEMKGALAKLRNVYYNLDMSEFDAVDAEYNKLPAY